MDQQVTLITRLKSYSLPSSSLREQILFLETGRARSGVHWTTELLLPPLWSYTLTTQPLKTICFPGGWKPFKTLSHLVHYFLFCFVCFFMHTSLHLGSLFWGYEKWAQVLFMLGPLCWVSTFNLKAIKRQQIYREFNNLHSIILTSLILFWQTWVTALSLVPRRLNWMMVQMSQICSICL